MPRSKRDKKVSLTKTKKKDLTFKKQLVDEIRRCVDDYKTIFLFSIENMRNAKLKDLRTEWRHSRFFFGKNKVMALGLGKTKETEVQTNLHKLAKYLIGQCGLLFTNKEEGEVIDWFSNYSESDYARSGNIATDTVMLPAGPLPEFPHSIEPHLRQLGMPTSLKRGVVTLISDFTVCKVGQPLKPEQARILKLLGRPMAEFKLIMKCVWSKDGKFKKLDKQKKKSGKAKEYDSVAEMEIDEAGEQETENGENDIAEIEDDDLEEAKDDKEESEEDDRAEIDDDSKEAKDDKEGDRAEIDDDPMEAKDYKEEAKEDDREENGTEKDGTKEVEENGTKEVEDSAVKEKDETQE